MVFTEEQKKRHCIVNHKNEYEANLSKQRYSHVADKYENIYKDKWVLDMGCDFGTGIVHILEQWEAKICFGIDFQPEAVESAREKYGSEKMSFMQGSIEKTPYMDKYFDVVTMIEVIEHNDEETVDVILREIHRVLKVGGQMYITTPEIRAKKEEFPRGSHYTEYAFQELVDIILPYGFELEWHSNKFDNISNAFLFKKIKGDENRS